MLHHWASRVKATPSRTSPAYSFAAGFCGRDKLLSTSVRVIYGAWLDGGLILIFQSSIEDLSLLAMSLIRKSSTVAAVLLNWERILFIFAKVVSLPEAVVLILLLIIILQLLICSDESFGRLDLFLWLLLSSSSVIVARRALIWILFFIVVHQLFHLLVLLLANPSLLLMQAAILMVYLLR